MSTQLIDSPDDVAEEILRSLFEDRSQRNDLYPRFKQIRELKPLHFSKYLNAWVASKIPDIKTVFLSPSAQIMNKETRLKPGWEQHPSSRHMAEYFVLLDGPQHHALRSPVAAQWQRLSIEKYRPLIRKISCELVDDFVGKGGGEFIREIAYKLPVKAITSILDVPFTDEIDWFQVSNDFNLCTEADCKPEEWERADKAALKLRDYWQREAKKKIGSNDEGMLSALVNGGLFDFNTAAMMAENLFIGGFETTTNTIGNGMWTLLQNLDEMRRIRTDPVARAEMANEILRYCPPIMMTTRTATAPIQVGDVEVKTGETIYLFIASANRDSDLFEDGDEFRAQPRKAAPIHFGYGIHICLGMWLARLEIEEIFNALLDKTSNIEFDGPPPPYRERLTLRCPSAMNLKVS